MQPAGRSLVLACYFYCVLSVCAQPGGEGGQMFDVEQIGHVSRLLINVASTYHRLHHPANESERKHFTRFWLIGHGHFSPCHLLHRWAFGPSHATRHEVRDSPPAQLFSLPGADHVFTIEQKLACLPSESAFPSPK